jgi:Flp pilus assembly protein TadG
MQQFLRKLLKDKDGNVAIELALVFIVLNIVILLGVDVSRMAIEKHQLTQYARAGAQYALLGQGQAEDSVAVSAAIADAAGDAYDGLTISQRNFCECPTGTSVDCDTGDCDGEVPPLFLTVTITKDYDYLFTLGAEEIGTINLQGTATVRVR